MGFADLLIAEIATNCDTSVTQALRIRDRTGSAYQKTWECFIIRV